MTETIIKEYQENGICYPRITINIRTIPCSTTGVILDQYHEGESVIYDKVVITDKYTWISWLSTSGRRVYMAIKDVLTEERFGDCYDVPSSSTGTEPIIQEYSEYGICYPRMTLNIRDLPCASTGTILDQYYIGESVIYDYVVITDKYVWISWLSRSGKRRYMAVKDITTDVRFGDCSDVPNGIGESNTPTGIETIISEYSESGICYPQETTNIRNIPCATNGLTLDYYYKGESVIYDYVVITNKYVWISWNSVSGRRVYMTVKDQTTGERWGICKDISSSSDSSTYSSSGIGMPGVQKIFIDAGHGGNDPGALGNGLKEKDIVLSIAQKLTKLFNAKGIQVSHSRYSDVTVGLSERAEMANNWEADLFISIHANALDGSGSAYGTECYTYPNSTAENKRLSLDIASSISSKLGTYNRGHKEADFAVLRLTNMPSVLIETAFIDNSKDADKLKNKQDDFANAIFEAIIGSTPSSSTLKLDEKNGFEHIVVSGQEGDVDRYKYNFIEPALKKLFESSYHINVSNEWAKNTTLTWLIDTTSYTSNDLENFKSTINKHKLPVKIVFVNSLNQFINYMNTGTIDGQGVRNQFIKEYTHFGHGEKGKILIGKDYCISIEDINHLDSTVFHSSFNSLFYTCNTATGNENSFAYAWQKHLNGLSTKACFNKTDYNYILGTTWLQQQVWEMYRKDLGYSEIGSRDYPIPDPEEPKGYWVNFN